MLKPNGIFKCSGCQLNFTQASDWRRVDGDLASTTDLHRIALQALPEIAAA